MTDEVEAPHLRDCAHLISRLRRQLPLIGEAMGVRSSQASPGRGGGSAKPRRRGRDKFDATSQSASLTAPLGGEWGIGYVSPFDAPPHGQDAKSHCDGICLDSSVWLDGVQIMEEGRMTDPYLKELAAFRK